MTTDLSRRVFLSACAGLATASGSRALAQNPQRGAARTFRGRTEDEWLALMATRPVVRMVSRFNSTAIVFCLDLGDQVMTSFKPERPGQESWWRHEVVSYRFAKLLGIENRVPPAVGRRVPASVFGRYVASDRLVVGDRAMIRGSASVWMPVLRGGGLHTDESRREWRQWLAPGAPIPGERGERARQIAVLLVFDWLMANTDRWNCCNIPLDERDDLVYRDNDAGWSSTLLNRINTPNHVQRLPRSLWERVRAVDGAALRAEVERDPLRAEGLIGRSECAGYDRRRARLIAHVEGLVRRHGESAVLAWP